MIIIYVYNITTQTLASHHMIIPPKYKTNRRKQTVEMPDPFQTRSHQRRHHTIAIDAMETPSTPSTTSDERRVRRVALANQVNQMAADRIKQLLLSLKEKTQEIKEEPWTLLLLLGWKVVVFFFTLDIVT